MSQDSMDNYMTPEALELLATGLKSFMEQKSFIDDATFDEISKEARFLSNRKLAEQCKMAKRRCHETRHLLDARWTIVKQKREDLLQTVPNTHALTVEQADQENSTTSQDGDVHSWQPNFTRSAPPTPALALRCSSNLEIKRRSQSMEDELANQVLQYIESEQALNAAQHQGTDVNISESEHLNCEIERSMVPEPDSQGESNSILPNEATVDCSSISSENHDEDALVEVSSSDIISHTSEDGGSVTGADDNVSDGATYFHDHCNHTVYRGDKFLDADHDITIPLDEDFHLNNNFLVVTSPSIESKHIIYTPPAKPQPADRPSLTQNHSSRVSSSESLLEGDTSCEDLDASVFSSKVTFMDGADVVSPLTSPAIENNPIITVDTAAVDNLTEPSANDKPQCKLSPVLSQKQKQKAMQKRRSFHGFTSAIANPIINFAKSWRNAEDNVKRLSVGSNVSENDELPTENTTPNPINLELSPVESIDDPADRLQQIESAFKERESSRILKNKRLEKTLSLVTGSSESLPR